APRGGRCGGRRGRVRGGASRPNRRGRGGPSPGSRDRPWAGPIRGGSRCSIAGVPAMSGAPNRARSDGGRGLPDLDLQLELVAELLPYPLADLVDQVEDVGRRGARLRDDEV